MRWQFCRKISSAITQHRGQARRPSAGTQGRQHGGVGVQHRLYQYLYKNNVRFSNETQWCIAFSKNMDWLLISLIHNNATRVKMQRCMKEFYRVLYLVTCVRVKISPLIKHLKRSYQEYNGIKDYFLISFSIQAFHIHEFSLFHVYFISIEFERCVYEYWISRFWK